MTRPKPGRGKVTGRDLEQAVRSRRRLADRRSRHGRENESGNGKGEYYTRSVAAHNVATRIRFGRAPLKDGARAAVEVAEALGSVGGVIVLDPNGNRASLCRCAGIVRAYVMPDGTKQVRTFSDLRMEASTLPRHTSCR